MQRHAMLPCCTLATKRMSPFASILLVSLCGVVYGGKVSVDLYYESMCPDCENFTLTSLRHALETVGEFISLNLIAYGKAKRVGNDQYECQHGPEECLGNLWAGCIWNKMNDPERMNTIYCMEEWNFYHELTPNYDNLTPDCLKKANASSNVIDEIRTCAKGSEGLAIQRGNADRTEALDLLHHYVPWLVINGKHTEDIQDRAEQNLTQVVCELLSSKPRACSNAVTF
jgi:interferon, gamma-inducible protein 30